MPTEPTPKKLDRAELASIISDRLQLDEEWSTATSDQPFREGVPDWRGFCSHLNFLVAAGCRWDVLLTCIRRFMTYNQDFALHPVTYDSDGEAEGVPVREMKAIPPPPKAAERNVINNDLNAVLRHLEDHQQLLYVLGALAPPNVEEFEELSAERSLYYLPILLRWVRRLLVERPSGNFKTVVDVGCLPLCVYVQMVARAKKAQVRPLLEKVAELLNGFSGEIAFSGPQLEENLRRFNIQYPSIYSGIRQTLRTLHKDSVRENNPPWKELVEMEAATRRRERRRGISWRIVDHFERRTDRLTQAWFGGVMSHGKQRFASI
jgi:hypothetical protein